MIKKLFRIICRFFSAIFFFLKKSVIQNGRNDSLSEKNIFPITFAAPEIIGEILKIKTNE